MLLFLGSLVHGAQRHWQVHTTQHFNVISDLPTEKALGLIEDIYLFDQVAREYISVSDNASPAKPPLNLLVFARRKDFVRLVNKRHFAAFAQPGLDETLLVIGPSNGADSLQVNTLHEYTHYLMRTQTISYPIWYEEGLATVLGASKFDRVTATAKIGWMDGVDPESERVINDLGLRRIVETRELTGWSGRRMAQFYRQSAELVHFLVFGSQRNYPDYRAGLQNYFANRGSDLFASLDVSKKALSGQWRRYLNSRTLPYQTLPATYEALPVISVELSDDERLSWHARAAEILNPRQAVELYKTLVMQQPANVSYQVDLARVLAVEDLEKSIKVLARAIDQAPDDPAVLVQQATLVIRQCTLNSDLKCLAEWRQATQLLRRALRQNPNRQDAIIQLGLTELYTGNPGRAINYLRIAYNRVPWSPKINLYLGECLRLLGSTQAHVHLKHARDWAYDDWVRNMASSALALQQEK